MRACYWLLSAYRSDSHAYWVDGLRRRHGEYDWQVFELPGRHFAWRIRSNPLSWLELMEAGLRERRPALILASSMVDLATLKGLHPALAGVPSMVYFHENQLAYPIIPGQVRSIEPVMVQIYAGLAADRLLFNSRYNQDSFLSGLKALRRRLPDGLPPDLATRLEAKASVLPVAVDPLARSRSRSRPRPPDRPAPLILWNHRWEHDKRPQRFAEAILELDRQGIAFDLALLGPRGPSGHPALDQLRRSVGHRIAVDGFLPRADYVSWLQQAAVVVSTAAHEFQGISLLEAVSAGAWPLVPD
jgi:glycosyltransferase involved in cell wall biosynthesis